MSSCCPWLLRTSPVSTCKPRSYVLGLPLQDRSFDETELKACLYSQEAILSHFPGDWGFVGSSSPAALIPLIGQIL